MESIEAAVIEAVTNGPRRSARMLVQEVKEATGVAVTKGDVNRVLYRLARSGVLRSDTDTTGTPVWTTHEQEPEPSAASSTADSAVDAIPNTQTIPTEPNSMGVQLTYSGQKSINDPYMHVDWAGDVISVQINKSHPYVEMAISTASSKSVMEMNIAADGNVAWRLASIGMPAAAYAFLRSKDAALRTVSSLNRR